MFFFTARLCRGRHAKIFLCVSTKQETGKRKTCTSTSPPPFSKKVMQWGIKWPVRMDLPFSLWGRAPGGVQNRAGEKLKNAFRPVPVRKSIFSRDKRPKKRGSFFPVEPLKSLGREGKTLKQQGNPCKRKKKQGIQKIQWSSKKGQNEYLFGSGPRKGAVVKKFGPSLESLFSLGFGGCPGREPGMSGEFCHDVPGETPGSVQNIFQQCAN